MFVNGKEINLYNFKYNNEMVIMILKEKVL